MNEQQTIPMPRRFAHCAKTLSHQRDRRSKFAVPRALAALVATVSVFVAASTWAAESRTLEIGDKAPDFKLPGVDDKVHALVDFGKSDVLVIVFTCNHCPTAQAYEERIKKLHADYKDRGVAVVAISPNAAAAVRLDELGYTDVGDSLEDMKVRAKVQNFQFPYLYDGDAQHVAKAYGPVATPHVFVFDRQRKLCYVGRIDDSDVKKPTSHDTRDAVDALLAGQPVPVEKTKVFGCSVKWANKVESAKQSIEKWNREEVSLATIDEQGIKTLVKNDSKKYRLINVWATWCGPCVTELPEFVTMNRMYRRRPFELITISADGPEKKEEALQLLKKLYVASTNYLFDSDDKFELIEALDDEWPGALPHTLLIAPGGKVVYRKNGPIEAQQLKTVIAGYSGKNVLRSDWPCAITGAMRVRKVAVTLRVTKLRHG